MRGWFTLWYYLTVLVFSYSQVHKSFTLQTEFYLCFIFLFVLEFASDFRSWWLMSQSCILCSCFSFCFLLSISIGGGGGNQWQTLLVFCRKKLLFWWFWKIICWVYFIYFQNMFRWKFWFCKINFEWFKFEEVRILMYFFALLWFDSFDSMNDFINGFIVSYNSVLRYN